MNSQTPTIKTILVVEDDFSIRETMQAALEAEGYRVVTASNGKEGLEKLKSVPKPALVLLDMMMPIMDGREFMAQVMSDVKLAPIPVLIVSATANEKTVKGAAEFVKKPADLDLLLDLVARYTKS